VDKIEKYIQDLKENNSTAKRFAAYKLGIIGDIRAFEPLLEALNDHNPFVRSNVIEALGNIGNIGAINHILEYIEDMDFTVRCSVIEAIGNIAKFNPNAEKTIYNEAVSKLTEALDDNKYLIRHYACDTLAKIGGEQVDKAIYSILINGSETAKEFAIWTIGKLQDESYEEQLLDMFEQSHNLNVKRAIICTLEKIGTDIKEVFNSRGIKLESIKEEVFEEETFNDGLFYKL